MSILKITGLGLIGATVALLVKGFRPEISVQVSVAVAAILFVYAALELSGIMEQLGNYIESIGLDSGYIAIVLKALGLAYLTRFASDICRDAGESAIAGKVELCGKVMIVAAALPAAFGLLDMIREILAPVS